MQDSVSVIMPSLNVQPFIRQCIESVMNQTLKNIEIICIDGGSTDGTLEILQEYAEKDNRIRLLTSDIKSYGHQVNLGLAAAQGEYIGIVETDDFIDADMYQSLYDIAASSDYPDVVKSGYRNLRVKNDQIIKTEKFPVHLKTGEVFKAEEQYYILWGHPSIWACIYKKSFLDGHHIKMKEVPGAGWVDNPFLFQTMCEAERICWVNKAYYNYRELNTNSSSQIKNCSIPLDRLNEMKDYLDEHFPGNFRFEEALFQRAVNYIYFIYKSTSLNKQDKERIKHLLKRFRRSVVILQPVLWGTKKVRSTCYILTKKVFKAKN